MALPWALGVGYLFLTAYALVLIADCKLIKVYQLRPDNLVSSVLEARGEGIYNVELIRDHISLDAAGSKPGALLITGNLG